MNPFSRPAMAEALRLTRLGDLGGATTHILGEFTGRRAAAQSNPVRDGGELLPHKLRVLPSGCVGDAAVQTVPETVNSRGQFKARRFGSAAGSLDYRLYIPANVAPGMPLVVMLHGCTQSPEDFARGTRMNALADELGFLVAYPGQTQAANPQKCWNWFKPGDQQRHRGEPALIAGIARQIMIDEHADPTRIYVAGLSAGGAAAAILADAYPDIFAAAGIHSGLACGAASSVSEALMAMRTGVAHKERRTRGSVLVPIITFHGDRDQTVHEANSGAIIAAASAVAGSNVHTISERGQSAAGRGFTREMVVNEEGNILIERWTVHGAGHAWAGGDAAGSFTDPTGPDASRAMLRFFLTHRLNARGADF